MISNDFHERARVITWVVITWVVITTFHEGFIEKSHSCRNLCRRVENFVPFYFLVGFLIFIAVCHFAHSVFQFCFVIFLQFLFTIYLFQVLTTFSFFMFYFLVCSCSLFHVPLSIFCIALCIL